MNCKESFYVALPSAASPRVCFDTGAPESIKSAFYLYRPHSLKGKFFKIIGRVSAFSGLLPFVGRFRIGKEIAIELDNYKESIKNEMDLDKIQIAFLKGTAGKHQKWIARIIHEKKLIGYAKIACASTAIKQLQIEADFLRDASRYECNNVTIPRLLASKFSDDISFIVISAPDDESNNDAPKLLNDVLVGFISKMAVQTGAKKCPLELILEKNFHLSGNSRIELIRRRLSGWLAELFVEHTYLCTQGHGDFAPWNVISKKSSKELFVYDWEYSSPTLPALFDAFHYTFMPAMLVEKIAPVNSIKNCLELCGNGHAISHLVDNLSIDKQQIPGYLALYLWFMLIRLADTQDFPENDVLNPSVEYFVKALDSLCFQFSHQLDKPTVLVSAYACDPEHGSEPGVGWQMVQSISRCADTWVITRKNNREPIEKGLLKSDNLHVYITNIDLPKWLGWWKRGQRGVRTYYYLWQFVAFYHYQKELKQLNFDLAHHITFVNDWIFSFLALTKLKFIWGPIGSCPKIPKGLAIDGYAAAKDNVRYLFQAFVRIIDPLFWFTAWRSKLIIGITADVCKKFPLSIFRKKCTVYPGIGIEELTEKVNADDLCKNEFTIAMVGNFIPIKLFHLAIHAFSIINNDMNNVRFIIVGKGQQEERLKSLSNHLGLQKVTEFKDWMSRADLLKLIYDADVFVFPSAEASGMVVLEAMIQGTPVVCLDYAGPGILVGDVPELKVKLSTNKKVVIESIAQKTLSLLKDKSLYADLSEKLRLRAINKYAWSRRHHDIEKWYSDVS